MKIYVASSWRNERQPEVVRWLRKAGHEVYDFRNPQEGNHGFKWEDVDPDWQRWSMWEYRRRLSHPTAEQGYRLDFEAMQWADAFVGVMPFGRSASMEMGWAAGHGKRTILLLSDGEPELMVKMFDRICCERQEVLDALDDRGNVAEVMQWVEANRNPTVIESLRIAAEAFGDEEEDA